MIAAYPFMTNSAFHKVENEFRVKKTRILGTSQKANKDACYKNDESAHETVPKEGNP